MTMNPHQFHLLRSSLLHSNLNLVQSRTKIVWTRITDWTVEKNLRIYAPFGCLKPRSRNGHWPPCCFITRHHQRLKATYILDSFSRFLFFSLFPFTLLFQASSCLPLSFFSSFNHRFGLHSLDSSGFNIIYQTCNSRHLRLSSSRIPHPSILL